MLRLAGFEVAEADLTGPLRQGPPGPPPRVPPGPGTLMVHVNGPMLPWAMRALGRRAVAGKRVIAVWNWELPVLAPDWRRGFRFAHGIWVSSRFTAGAVEAEPGAPPVSVVPYMVPEPDPSPLGRADFGLPDDAFVALSVFDAGSSIARKNPLAAVAAHRAAFGDRADRVLVLKTHGTEIAGPAWREVAEAAAAAPNIRVLDRAMDRRDLWALVLAADCFLSTHRSEGFGFGIAEAMRAGAAGARHRLVRQHGLHGGARAPSRCPTTWFRPATPSAPTTCPAPSGPRRGFPTRPRRFRRWPPPIPPAAPPWGRRRAKRPKRSPPRRSPRARGRRCSGCKRAGVSV